MFWGSADPLTSERCLFRYRLPVLGLVTVTMFGVASHSVKFPPRLGLWRIQAAHLCLIGLVRLRVRVMVVFEIELPLRLPQNDDPLV